MSHHAAAVVFPLAGFVLVVGADGAAATVACIVYVLGLTSMYAVSAAYHRGDWTPAAKRRMRRLDHSMILVGIASTYTPVAVVGLDRDVGIPLLVAVWVLAAVGVAVRNLWLGAPRWLTAGIYVAVGWVAVAVLPTLADELGGGTVALLLAGGLLYSLGALVYWRRWPDPAPATFGYHEVFHALVVAAGACFYFAIAGIVLV